MSLLRSRASGRTDLNIRVRIVWFDACVGSCKLPLHGPRVWVAIGGVRRVVGDVRSLPEFLTGQLVEVGGCGGCPMDELKILQTLLPGLIGRILRPVDRFRPPPRAAFSTGNSHAPAHPPRRHHLRCHLQLQARSRQLHPPPPLSVGRLSSFHGIPPIR